MTSDGNKTTLFEHELQLYCVTFMLHGASISNVELYRAELKTPQQQTPGGPRIHGFGIDVQFSVPTMLAFERVFDQALIDKFKEIYTPKAVVNRIS